MFTQRSLLGVGSVLAISLALSACSTANTGSAGGGSGSTGSSSESAATFNDQDVMFAQGMIVHHTQAIEMSDTILAKDGIDPRVTDLAQNIKDAQTPEIDQLQGYLDGWGAPTEMQGMDGMSGMAGMGGMMSKSDMADLESATGLDASRLFLEQMTRHHMGAVQMAQMEVDNGQDPDATALAQKIIDDQTAELALMKDLLASL